MPTLDTGSFDGKLTDPELIEFIANAALGGAPFARSLTVLPTAKGAISIPRSNPVGFDWVAEGQSIPDVDLNDDADVIAVAKLSGIVTLTNEFWDDADLPVSDLLATAVSDAMGASLDTGLLIGAGPPEPVGVLASAPTATEVAEDMRQAVILAWGELVDAGASPDRIVAFAKASVIAAELGRNSTTMDTPIYADGAGGMVGPGIALRAVPTMPANTVLVADIGRTYTVQRSDFEVAFSGHARFRNDETLMRIKARYAVACPTPGKALRLANFGQGS